MNAIEIDHLTKRYGETTAVDALSLSVPEGAFFSLLGVNGAGKTTTVKMLCCLTKPDSGDARLLGESIVSAPEKVRTITNLSPQETAVADHLTVEENLRFMAELYGATKAEAKRQTEEIATELSLTDVLGKRAAVLSGGYQRRLSVAMALISRPKILFLDEPTLGLDILARRELWRLLRSLKGKVTVVLTTHYLEEAEALSDGVAIMVGGRLVAVGSPAELVEKSGKANFEDAFVYYCEGETGDER